MFDLTGKRALVTGASGAIGAAIARALHAHGAAVALHGTRAQRLEALAEELGERAHVTAANLADAEALAGLPKAAEAALGGLDILVNNAGITRDQLALRMKDDDWDQVFDINLKAAFQLAKAVLRPMMKARHGRIISISSVVAATGNPGQTNYAAAKAGLEAMSKSLAQEVASRGITVNCLAPGFVRSEMTDALDDAQRDKLAAGIPIGRLGEGGDVAAGVVYLASDEAGWVTGQVLHVNGGMSMI